MIHLEDLEKNGIKIYQDDALYCFTSDSVLLSRFTAVKKNDTVADFCSGSGIVGFNLYALNPVIKSVTLFEMQTPLYELSKKSIEYNKLEKVFSAVNCKVQDAVKEYNEKFSLIVCNPPYMEVDRGEGNENESIKICKSEIFLKLEELIFSASRCLKFGGRFNMVNRADRLCDIFCLMRKYNLEPKKMQFVSGGDKSPYLVMVEGVKGGKAGIKVLSAVKN